MTLCELLAAALATWQAVEIWRHSYLMAEWRAYIETWFCWDEEERWQLWRQRMPNGPDWAWPVYERMLGLQNFVADVLGCPACLSVWVGMVAAALMLGGLPFSVPVWMLAVSRLANLGNDVLHGYCRTPRANRLNSGIEGDQKDGSSLRPPPETIIQGTPTDGDEPPDDPATPAT